MSRFILSKPSQQGTVKTTELSEIFSNWKAEEEHWLFVAPHDDDIILGAGLLIQKAQEAGVKMSVLVTTDGRMGYCSSEQKENIREIRHKETLRSFAMVDIDDIEFLNFPDGSLSFHMGGRFSNREESWHHMGLTGMQPAYTHAIRKRKPTRIFVPGGSDYHPDHKLTYQELLISVFHSGGDIWPELGSPLPWTPSVYEMAIYCDFEEAPNLRIDADEEALEKKLEAVLAYQSQPQIATLINNVREAGSIEFFRDLTFNFYSPNKYKDLF
jgi:LmbE family N-acetylglucosaminyl deacetylase